MPKVETRGDVRVAMAATFSREPQLRPELHLKNALARPQALREWTTALLPEFGCPGSERLAAFTKFRPKSTGDSDEKTWPAECQELPTRLLELEPLGQVAFGKENFFFSNICPT